MSYSRTHSATQRSFSSSFIMSSAHIPGSSTQTLPPRMSPTILTQRRSAIPTRSARNTNAQSPTELTTSPSGDTVRRQNSRAGPALTTFRHMRGAEVSGGFFVNTTGPVSFHNESEPSRRPVDNPVNVAVGTNGNVHSTHDHNSIIPTPGPSQNAEYDIYYNQLLLKGRGTPLWEPGPQMTFPNEYRRNGVSIGDVGILYRTGDFAFLFNIFLPADHDINLGRVPNGFIPLDKSKVEKTIKKSVVYDRGSCLASSSLRRTGSSDFAFQTTGEEGAVLVMPDGALSEDLRHHKLVVKYIADNAEGWYEYVESDDCGMPTENGDIRVVIGMDKVSSWGMATFENVEEPLQFEFKDDGRGSHARTYKWERIVAGRAGPPEEETRDLLQGPDTSPLRNQCVFVRTLNVSVAGKVRDELAVYEVRASCFRDSFSESSWHQTRPGQRNPNTQSWQIGQPVSHPSKLLNKYLLEKCPNAKVVITKDSDWMSVITENDTPTSNFEDICARVLASHTICENEGVVTLKKKKNFSSTGSIPDPITNRQQTTSEDLLPMTDVETYTTGRLFLKAPDDPPQTAPPDFSDILMEKRPYDQCPQIGESKPSLHLRASCFENLNSSGDGDDGGTNIHHTEDTIDKGRGTPLDELLCFRSKRRRRRRKPTTPVADGANSVNGGEISKSALKPSSAPLSASRIPVQEGTYSAQGTTAMPVATNKAKKVIESSRPNSKSLHFVSSRRVLPLPFAWSASSNTINPLVPSTAPGLAESDRPPRLVVTSPNSAPSNGEPPWEPIRNTLINYFDDRPERAEGSAHLKRTPATKLSHSSSPAAEQEQNLTIQETSQTNASFEPFDMWEQFFDSEVTRTQRIHPSAYTLTFLLLHTYVMCATAAVLGLKWLIDDDKVEGKFGAAQGFIKMFGAMNVALSTLEITLYSLIGVRMMTGVSSTRISAIVGTMTMLAAVALPTLNKRSEPNFMGPTPYWCWINTKTECMMVKEYLWMWTALFFSLFLYLPLYLLARGSTALKEFTCWKFSTTFAVPAPHSRDQLPGSLAMLPYPAVYFLCTLPLSILRWTALVQEARYGGGNQMPLAATLALEAICSLLGFRNLVLLFTTKAESGLFGQPMSISPARPLSIWDPCPPQDRRPPSIIPSFLNIRLQHALMRLACSCALALLSTLTVAGGYPTEVYAVPLFTLVTFAVRLVIPGGSGVILILAEIASYLYFSRLFLFDNLMPFRFVLIGMMGWSIALNLIPVVFLQVARICEGEIPLLRRLNKFDGESRLMTISRASCAALTILAIMISSSYNILLETASPPVKVIRSFSIPQDTLDSMFVWDVQLTVPQTSASGATVNISVLKSAIEVWIMDDNSQSCSFVPEPGVEPVILLDPYYDLMPSLTFKFNYRNYSSIPATYVEQGPPILNQPAFGLLDAYEYFPVSDITFVSRESPNSPGIVRICILAPNDFSEWKFDQDYREKSVLKGFAVVGGLWAHLCGVFAMIYGLFLQ